MIHKNDDAPEGGTSARLELIGIIIDGAHFAARLQAFFKASAAVLNFESSGHEPQHTP